MSGLYSFGKSERLSRKSQIDKLFGEGRSFNLGVFRIIYMLNPVADKEPVQVLITIPRKKFPRAVDRNRLRRMIREAYRLHKNPLISQIRSASCGLHLGFIYISDRTDTTFTELEQQMTGCLARMSNIAREQAV